MKTMSAPVREHATPEPEEEQAPPGVSQPRGNAAEAQGVPPADPAGMTPLLDAAANQEEEGPPEDFDLFSLLADACGPMDQGLPDPAGDGAALVSEAPDLGQGGGDFSGDLSVPEVAGDAASLQSAADVAPRELTSGPQVDFQSSYQPSLSTDLDSPDLDEAYGSYMGAALDARDRISCSLDDFAADLQLSAEVAEQEVRTSAEGLRDYVDTAVDSAIDATGGVCEEATDRVEATLQTQTETLQCLNDDALQQVLDQSEAHQEAVATDTDDLATRAERLGNERADALLTETLTASDAISAHESSVIGSYSSHNRANDIRITVGRLGTEASGKLQEEAGPAAQALREAGVALAEKLREDGEAYEENIASGDEETRELFECAEEEAEQALAETSEDATVGLEENQSQVVEGLEEMGDAMKAGVCESEDLQVQGIGEARDEGLETLQGAGDDLLDPLDAQMCEVEDEVQGAEPGSEEGLAEALGEQADAVSGQADGVVTHLDQANGQVQDAFCSLADEATQAYTATQQEVDTPLDEVVQTSRDSANEAIDGYETSLDEQVQGFGEAWAEEADDKCEALDEAGEEADEGLSEVWTDGSKEIEDNYTEASQAVEQLRGETLSTMSSEADRIANQKWWQRIGSAIGSFIGGMFDGLVSMLKGLALAVLIVAAIVLVVAAVILIAKGAAALAAAAAAVAAFVASIATVLKVIGLVLTAVGVVMALINVIGAWMDPDLTTDEKWRASGKGTFDILSEIIPDFGLGGIFKRLRRTPQGTHRGLGSDPSRRVNNPTPNHRRVAPADAPAQRRAEFDWAQENGYGGDWETFNRQRDQGRNFDQSRRRWTNDAPVEDNARWLGESTNTLRDPAQKIEGHLTTDWSETEEQGSGRSLHLIRERMGGE